MRIKMIETRRGSEDGFSIKLFEAGQEYDVRHTMGVDFIRKGWAKDVDTRSMDELFNEMFVRLYCHRSSL
jgi:hypothetical protein